MQFLHPTQKRVSLTIGIIRVRLLSRLVFARASLEAFLQAFLSSPTRK